MAQGKLLNQQIFCFIDFSYLKNIFQNSSSMNLCKHPTRKERISDLIHSFSIQRPSPEKPRSNINRSFNCMGMKQLGQAEKEMLNRTIDSYVRHDSRQLERLEPQSDKSVKKTLQLKWLKSGIKLRQSKSLHSFVPQKKQLKHINLSLSNKHIFIQRKYNSKIAYQMQTYIQARRIQDERKKLKQQSHQTSPLLHQMLRKVRFERATTGVNQSRHFPTNSVSIHQQYEDEKLTQTISKYIKHQKETQFSKIQSKIPQNFLDVCKNPSQNYCRRGMKAQ